jgi:hypothetical protein
MSMSMSMSKSTHELPTPDGAKLLISANEAGSFEDNYQL